MTGLHSPKRPNIIPCSVALKNGNEMGWFEHGSTIIMFVPAHWELAQDAAAGTHLQAGQALFRRVTPTNTFTHI